MNMSTQNWLGDSFRCNGCYRKLSATECNRFTVAEGGLELCDDCYAEPGVDRLSGRQADGGIPDCGKRDN